MFKNAFSADRRLRERKSMPPGGNPGGYCDLERFG
jgi:hypothetical protein